MKINSLLSIFLLLLTIACFTSCKSPGKYPPEFHSYTPSEQNLIRSGKIAVGFSEEQVRMALGKPDVIRSDPGSSDRYFWDYKKTRFRAGSLYGLERSLPQGEVDPSIVRNSSFYDEMSHHITFERSTKKVVYFQAY